MKTRSDSLAGKLKPSQRDELCQLLCDGLSVKKAVELCASWGVRTSTGSISRFYSSQGFLWRLELAKAAAEASKSATSPDLDKLTDRIVDQQIFAAVSHPDCPPKILIALRGLKVKADALKLAERRVDALEKKLESAKGAVTDSKLTPAEREARIRQILGVPK